MAGALSDWTSRTQGAGATLGVEWIEDITAHILTGTRTALSKVIVNTEMGLSAHMAQAS